MCIDNSLGPHVDWTFPHGNPYCVTCQQFKPYGHQCISTTGVLTFKKKAKPFNAEREFLGTVIEVEGVAWLKHFDFAFDKSCWVGTDVTISNDQMQEAAEKHGLDFLKRVLPTKKKVLEDFLDHKDIDRVVEDLEYV